MKNKESSLLQNRLFILAISTIVLMSMGLIYAWSVFIKPLMSEYGWTGNQTAHIFTVSISMFCLGGITSGFLLRRYKVKVVFLASAVLMLTGFMGCAFTDSLSIVYLCYGILCSVGVGLSYNAVLSTTVKWFPDKPSFCSGVLLMGFGAGGFLLSNIMNYIIINAGARVAFITIGVASLIILIFSSIIVTLPNVLQENNIKHTNTQKIVNFSTKFMLKNVSFWVIFIWGIFAVTSGLAVIGKASPFAEGIGMTSSEAAFAVGIIAVLNGFGRVIVGYLYPKINRKILLFVVSLLFSTASIFLYFSIKANSIACLFIGFCAAGLAYGACPSLGVSMVREFFGDKYYPTNLSVFNIHLLAGSLLGSSLIGSLISTPSTVATAESSNFFVIPIAMSISCIISTIFVFFVKKPEAIE